jgi:transcriptional activator of cad operon
MESPTTTLLRIGAWCVDRTTGQISRDDETTQVEARTMRLLLYLAEHAGEVVSIDTLLDQVWAGVTVSPDSVYQAIASLRRALGDDPRHPTYIATVPRLGYRLLAPVTPSADPSAGPNADPSADSSAGPRPRTTGDQPPSSGTAAPTPRRRSLLVVLAIAGALELCLALGAPLWLHRNHHVTSTALAARSPRSIAVLPFLDLTETMTEEPFADGMTEELIDKLSQVPGLRVPSPTAAFYFKGKQIPIADIAKTLGVAYVLDGSVRKSGSRLRVATRMMRADNGYIIWSATYDRPFHDLLMVQDDIASQVTRALATSIIAGPNHSPSQ